MRADERAVLERAIQRVTEQAANADATVVVCWPQDGPNPVRRGDTSDRDSEPT
jgi:hypothetical protein